MIRTLRITGLLVVVFAVLVVGSVLGFVPFLNRDTAGEEQARKVLSSPGAVERFRTQHADKVPATEDRTPPLVQQAKLLAGILNPPVKVSPPNTSSRTSTPTIRRPVVSSSAKFDLVGTSYLPSAPQESFAYIRLPGNEYRWVKQGSEVGHLVIKEVRSGSITYLDGQSSAVLAVEAIPETSSLLTSGAAATPAAPAIPEPSRPATVRTVDRRTTARPSLQRPTPRSTTKTPPSQMDEKDEEALGELVNRLRDMQKSFRSDKTGSQVDPEDRKAMMDKVISEFKSSSRVSDEEAEKLDDLGKQLNGTKEESIIEKRREAMRRVNRPSPPKSR
ncbi:MAG: hypothetical protein JW741_14095 [Sedimentisphaerales bacterium]|nr:hypothetical protein [Sedimentisphaerales bacterium]